MHVPELHSQITRLVFSYPRFLANSSPSRSCINNDLTLEPEKRAKTMASSKKKKHSKSMSQKVISAGTSGLPSPIRSFLSGRIVASLIVVCLPLLFISGIVSVDFQNGRPHLSFNRDKAKEAKVMAEDKIHELQGQESGFVDQASDAMHSLVGHEKPAFSLGQANQQSMLDNFSHRVDSVRKDMKQDSNGSWMHLPSHQTNQNTSQQPGSNGPFSRFRGRFDQE